jgi:5-methylcytosine-specific restriction enzyme subunit McrC
MRSTVVVREFATLTTASVVASLDQASVSASAFDWLCAEGARLRTAGAELMQFVDRRALRLDNYVGVIETPCGTSIEILPKHVDGLDAITSARRILRKMLITAMDLRPRETAGAGIDVFDVSIKEWIIDRFLGALDRLVKRGIRFDYQRIDDEQRFLKGRLDVSRQIRQPPGRQHIFQIQHDVFEPDRPENRLIRSALERVRKATQLPSNWRLAHELASFLSPIPTSANVAHDFRAWRSDRLTAHYREIKPWCSLILNEQLPLALAGAWRGPSLLFPMERLFERYVTTYLRGRLLPNASLTATARSKYLCNHQGFDWFQLQPDMLIERGDGRWILDAKWKRLNTVLGKTEDKYELQQGDFYQMFAYGHKYLRGKGDLFLIYPKTVDFGCALAPFHFSESLSLRVIAFDLDRDELVGDVAGLPLRLACAEREARAVA